MTRLGAELTWVRIQIRGKRILFYRKRPDHFWSLPILIFNGYQVFLSPLSKAAEVNIDLSPLSVKSGEVKKKFSLNNITTDKHIGSSFSNEAI